MEWVAMWPQNLNNLQNIFLCLVKQFVSCNASTGCAKLVNYKFGVWEVMALVNNVTKLVYNLNMYKGAQREMGLFEQEIKSQRRSSYQLDTKLQ